MRVVAIANQKGGCGKTTTSINLAACLAHLEKKTLLVDLDPQGHSSCGLGIDSESLPWTLYDLLKIGVLERPHLSDVIYPVNDYLAVLPSYVVLGQVEEEYANLPDWQKPLKAVLDPIYLNSEDYDFIIIDCPPNLGILTYNAFEAADEVIIPIEPSFFSLHGLAKISETLAKVKQNKVSDFGIHALMTIFDSEASFSKEVYDDVSDHFKDKMFKTIIHQNVVLKEAASAGQSVVQYAPESDAFKDHWKLALEYLERMWDHELPDDELGWRNAVKHRFGPKRVVGGILFQALNDDAHSVEIAGDFNQWIPEELIKRDSDGLWQVVLPITQGSYRYKFIVDGDWQMDPYHPQQKKNDYGSFDSFLELNNPS